MITYARFLALALLPWLGVLLLLHARDRLRNRRLPASLQGISPGWSLLAHVAVAVIYTTPWDNYLVATGVWTYSQGLVAGITLGYVPLEEYLFFVVQSLVTGLWTIWLARRIDRNPSRLPIRRRSRQIALVAMSGVWLAAATSLLLPIQPTRYLALQLAWALPPIALQVAFGLASLVRRWRLVTTAILLPTAYLSLADTIPLGAGTWTISAHQSLGWHVFGPLPFEELTFFLLTNTLLVFGMILFMASESLPRARAIARVLAPSLRR